jgi:hypothetical protein
VDVNSKLHARLLYFQFPLKEGWVGPRAGLTFVEKRKMPCPCQGSNPGSSNLWPTHYNYYAIMVHLIFMIYGTLLMEYPSHIAKWIIFQLHDNGIDIWCVIFMWCMDNICCRRQNSVTLHFGRYWMQRYEAVCYVMPTNTVMEKKHQKVHTFKCCLSHSPLTTVCSYLFYNCKYLLI